MKSSASRSVVGWIFLQLSLTQFVLHCTVLLVLAVLPSTVRELYSGLGGETKKPSVEVILHPIFCPRRKSELLLIE